jgi:uncharacterized membrane protein YebE (DUF533 family)
MILAPSPERRLDVFDFNGVLEALQTDPKARGTAATGAAAGLATGLLMGKGGHGMLGGVAKYGALAALGGIAYKAWQRSQAGESAAPAAGSQPAAPAPAAFIPPPDDDAANHALGQSLLRAMIAAAKADGRIDADENRRIFARMETMNLDADCKAFVFDELSAPLNLDAVVAGADTPEHAAEIYAASLVAIEAESPAEKGYLIMLAGRLGLAPELVTELHRAAALEA